MVEDIAAAIRGVHKDIHCCPTPRKPLGSRRPMALLSDSTRKLNNSKASRHCDYTTDGGGFCQLFDASRKDAFLLAGVWSGALLSNLLLPLRRLPRGLAGIVLAWMGNDFEQWCTGDIRPVRPSRAT